MWIVNFFAYAYCGTIIYLFYLWNRYHLPLRESGFIFFLVPIICTLVLSDIPAFCALKCVILSLPLIIVGNDCCNWSIKRYLAISVFAFWIFFGAIDVVLSCFVSNYIVYVLSLLTFYKMGYVAFVYFYRIFIYIVYFCQNHNYELMSKCE